MKVVQLDRPFQARSTPPEERERWFRLFAGAVVAFRLQARRMDIEPHTGGFSIKTVFSGRERYVFGDRETLVRPGEILLVNPGETYASEIRAPVETDSFSLFFPRPWLDAELAAGRAQALRRALDSGFSSVSLQGAPDLSQALSGLAAALASGADPLALEERLEGISRRAFAFGEELARAVDGIDAAGMATRAERLRRVLRARDLLDASVTDGAALADLAAEACMSEFHLLRAFREAFGVTPAKYLEALRMNRAKALLERTDLPVGAVARQCGYASLSAFGRAFRRRWGRPATALRG